MFPFEIGLDGTGIYDNEPVWAFFDHMLDQLARHSLIDMSRARDRRSAHRRPHHTVEDVASA
jgi:imidazoleglycerol-phosphate dehydratase